MLFRIQRNSWNYYIILQPLWWKGFLPNDSVIKVIPLRDGRVLGEKQIWNTKFHSLSASARFIQLSAAISSAGLNLITRRTGVSERKLSSVLFAHSVAKCHSQALHCNSSLSLSLADAGSRRLSLIYFIFFGENAQIPERRGRIQTNKLTHAAPAGSSIARIPSALTPEQKEREAPPRRPNCSNAKIVSVWRKLFSPLHASRYLFAETSLCFGAAWFWLRLTRDWALEIWTDGWGWQALECASLAMTTC